MSAALYTSILKGSLVFRELNYISAVIICLHMTGFLFTKGGLGESCMQWHT